MKAFQLTLNDETAVIAASTASKARYAIYLHLRDLGMRVVGTGKPWPQLTDLSVRRSPGFDDWAGQQREGRHVTQPYAEREQAHLSTQQAA